jgi:hypothetical protein
LVSIVCLLLECLYIKIKTIFRLDENGNGLFDVGEPPLSNVTVTLHDANGILIGTTVTDASGLYAFNSDQTTSTMLPLYDYEVRVALGQSSLSSTYGQLLPTATDVGVDDTIDSDATYVHFIVVTSIVFVHNTQYFIVLIWHRILPIFKVRRVVRMEAT